MAPHSSTLAWKIPWMEEPGRLQSMGSLRVRHDWATSFTFHFHALEKEMATHSSVLAWRIPGTGEPGGLPSMGSHRVGHDWSDLAAAALHVIMVVLNFSAQLFTSEQVFLCILKTCWTHSSENFFWYKFFKMFCVFYNQVIVKQGQFFLFFSTWFNLPANTLNESGKVPNHRGRFLSFTVEISVSHWDI